MKTANVIRFLGLIFSSLILVFLAIGGCVNKQVQPPVAKLLPVTNTYHGVEVVDNYQWMEDSEDSDVKKWTEGQTAYTEQFLDRISYRRQIAEQLKEFYDQASSVYGDYQWNDNRLFCMKKQPPLDQSLLVLLESPYDLTTEKIVVDPNTIDNTGRTAIDFYVVSPDGMLVAVSLSHNGTEDGDVHVFKVADGAPLTDIVPGVNGPTAGGDVAWLPDGSGFFYTHYPRKGERPPEDMRFFQQVYLHKLGTDTSEDTYVTGEQFPRIAEIEFETSADSRHVLAVVSDGDGGEFTHHLRMPSGEWVQITHNEDLVSTAKFGPDNALYMLSTKGTPNGRILRLSPGETDFSLAETVVPESKSVIKEYLPTDNYLYVTEMVGGPSTLRVIEAAGNFQSNVDVPEIASVQDLTSLGGDEVLYRVSTYLEPTACYTYHPGERKSVRTALCETSIADYSNIEVAREYAVSKDGTRVPMTVLRPKGTELNGQNPTILSGYGGYGINLVPNQNSTLSMWLNRGGIYVIANLRGGGEFGEKWHLQGNLINKQNVFDDFAACAEHLIDTGYTNPSRLAIRGGSNGGLLVGATMVQHPDLFKAVVCEKGVLDMLRVELFPNGAFNITEYGTVTDPEQFEALYAYSPYANVKSGVSYPDVIFTADDNDWRVSSSNSRKMVALMQAKATDDCTILLRMSTGIGHGIGSSMTDRLSQETDVWAFLFDRLNVNYNNTIM